MESIRSEGDQRLFDELLANSRVQDALKAVELAEEKGQIPKARRSLMARGLRLSSVVAPNLNAIVKECRTLLGIDEEVECYVQPSPMYNAGIFRPEDERLLVMFSSSLVEAFEAPELRFVVGHELAHHVFGHHGVPMGVLFDPRFGIRGSLALKLSAWQRYAEISADRAGVLCTGNFQGAASALFKLASGLSQAPDEAQVLAFLEQARELGAAAQDAAGAGDAHQEEWFSTHPFSPLRVEAANLFSQSAHLTGGGGSAAWLEVQTAELMQVMEPGYLKEDSESAEAMRRVLFAAGILLAAKDGEISPDEISGLNDLLGPDTVPSEPNVDKLTEVLPQRIEAVMASTTMGRRAQLVRDLATIARADGRVALGERRFLCKLAKDLKVDKAVVESALRASDALD